VIIDQRLLDRLAEDPYPVHEELRAAGPVLWSEELRRWLVTGHAESVEVLRDPRFSADRRNWEGFREVAGRRRGRSMLASDPPDHTRLRNLVQQVFTPRVVERLRPRVQELVDGCLDRAAARGGMDVVADLAYPLPVTVIADLLGIPAEERPGFRELSDRLVGGLDEGLHDQLNAEAAAARDELMGYLESIVVRRRRQPGDDLISGLIRVGDEEEDRLSGPDLLSMCVLLLVAGHETSVSLIGNGVLTLLRHPEQLRRLRDEAAPIETAVEELLRFESPIQMTGRIASADVELGGQTVRRGQMVTLLLGAANRDPRTFAAPASLDLGRAPNSHLAFGRGIHFCLGAPLARLEAQVAIATLVRRFPAVALGGEPARRPTIVIRGIGSVPVVLAA
jgi:cytochrome P450